MLNNVPLQSAYVIRINRNERLLIFCRNGTPAGPTTGPFC